MSVFSSMMHDVSVKKKAWQELYEAKLQSVRCIIFNRFLLYFYPGAVGETYSELLYLSCNKVDDQRIKHECTVWYHFCIRRTCVVSSSLFPNLLWKSPVSAISLSPRAVLVVRANSLLTSQFFPLESGTSVYIGCTLLTIKGQSPSLLVLTVMTDLSNITRSSSPSQIAIIQSISLCFCWKQLPVI